MPHDQVHEPLAASRSLIDPFERLIEEAGRARRTHPDAPRVRKLFDALAWRVPDDNFGFALYMWAEEVTRIVEGLPNA